MRPSRAYHREHETDHVSDLFDAMIGPGSASAVMPKSDLDDPIWSVISFDELEAGGLTYRQASDVIDELGRHGISGLCIVTDDAAAEMLVREV